METADARGLGDALSAVLAQATSNAELVGSLSAASLIDLWNESSIPEGTLNLVVVFDYPFGIDEAADEALRRCAEAGTAAGVVLLVTSDDAAKPARGVLPSATATSLMQLSEHGGTWVILGLPGQLSAAHEP